jgi:8-oxo-dGTP pyrophosphatase MutT (NUDIX family)
MKQVAKLVIIDNDNKYLLMYRNGHPTFGDDADLPGGTLEDDEKPLEGMVREVYEEAGITIAQSGLEEIYEGTEYSTHDTHYSLFRTKLDSRPTITMSWEHSAYEWIEFDDFMEKAKNANDTYMHMVYDTLK